MWQVSYDSQRPWSHQNYWLLSKACYRQSEAHQRAPPLAQENGFLSEIRTLGLGSDGKFNMTPLVPKELLRERYFLYSARSSYPSS